MESLTEFIQGMGQNAFLALFGVGFLEAFVFSSFLVNGTLAIIGMGALLHAQAFDPGIVLWCWVGVVVGCNVNFFISKIFRDRLLRNKMISGALKRKGGWAERPMWFFVTGHLGPHMRPLVAPVAALGGMPYSSFLTRDLVGSFIGVFFQLGLGYAAASLAVSVQKANGAAQAIGVAIILFMIVMVIKIRLKRLSTMLITNPNRGLTFAFNTAIHYPHFWVRGHIERHRIGRQLKITPILKCIKKGKPGDIVLIGRGYAAPWGGIWSHCGLISRVGMIVHADTIGVVEESVESFVQHCFPPCVQMCVIAVKASQHQQELAISTARASLGTSFRLWSKHGATTFNCASLVWSAWQSAGVKVSQKNGLWATPADFAESPFTEVRDSVYLQGGERM